MAYASVQAMKDALGDMVLLQGINAQRTFQTYTFDMLPADAQVSIFQWVNNLERARAQS